MGYSYDDRFRKLAVRINNALIANDGLIGDQKEQVELLMDLEERFRLSIQKYEQAKHVYKKFIYFITVENGNILNAKPYFREKIDVFNSKINKAIKNNDIELLMTFHINYQLINFIVKSWRGYLPAKTNKIYLQFLETRRILIENNLPLAVNRAKLFYRKTPKKEFTLMDFIDICTRGLISGIDKYVGSYTKVWRSVCIGRMVGYMISEYSKTFLRLYPTEKKILYRANSLKHRMRLENINEIVQAVNESFLKEKEEGKAVPKLPITEVYLRTLMNGSAYTSVMTESKSENKVLSLYDISQSNEENAEEMLIKDDLIKKVYNGSKNLSIIERKILKLKGVDL